MHRALSHLLLVAMFCTACSAKDGRAQTKDLSNLGTNTTPDMLRLSLAGEPVTLDAHPSPLTSSCTRCAAQWTRTLEGWLDNTQVAHPIRLLSWRDAAAGRLP